MADKETRTEVEEKKQLTEAETKVLTTLEDYVKVGASDKNKKNAFQNAVSEFQNIVRFSLVTEGGLQPYDIEQIAIDLKDNLKAKANYMSDAAKKESGPSSINLNYLSADIRNAEADVLYTIGDTLNARTFSADTIAKEYKEFGITVTDPRNLPNVGASKSK